MVDSQTRDIFLVIYSSRLFPSHWGVFVPSSEGSDTGTLINVIGDPSVGFEHEFKRDYGKEDDGRVSKILLLGKVIFEHVKSREEVGRGTNDIPDNILEDIAFSIPPPSKSLRSSGNSVSRKVEIKNCQSWLREYVVTLVEKQMLGQYALDVVGGAPTISSLDTTQ